MKLSKAQMITSVLAGVITLWLLQHFMEKDIESARAAIQRQWLIVGLLLAGSYVAFRYGPEEGSDRGRSEEGAGRKRQFKIVAWIFLIVGVLLALRLVWQAR